MIKFYNRNPETIRYCFRIIGYYEELLPIDKHIPWQPNFTSDIYFLFVGIKKMNDDFDFGESKAGTKVRLYKLLKAKMCIKAKVVVFHP